MQAEALLGQGGQGSAVQARLGVPGRGQHFYHGVAQLVGTSWPGRSGTRPGKPARSKATWAS